MSLIAAITVIDCDRCKKISVMRTDVEYDSFTSTWYDGIGVHFCVECREKPEALVRIAEDERLRGRLASMIRDEKIADPTVSEGSAEYVN